MLQTVKDEPVGLGKYRSVLSGELYSEIQALAKNLRGLRVLHINSNSKRGGVAEILHSSVPLLNGLGLDAHWKTFKVPDDIYHLSKYIHNGLQGDFK